MLTADHCADGTDHQVVANGQSYPAVVHQRSFSSEVDVAVLVAATLPNEIEALPCGLVNRDQAVHLEGCQALGYPSWKGTPERPKLAQTRGFVPTAEDADPHTAPGSVRLMTLKITDPEATTPRVPDGELEQSRSQWAGMSGAVLVSGDDLVIGVVRSHAFAEGGRSLTVTPLDALNFLPAKVSQRFWAALGVGDPSELPRLPVPMEATSATKTALNLDCGVISTYIVEVEEIAPEILEDREQELAEIERFCSGEETYQWWQADAWSGKTALASWLVLHPPPDVTVVSFFITGRQAGKADSVAFTEALIEQLTALFGDEPPTASTRDAQRQWLMKTVAEQLDAVGRRLLIVIDGLDEDRGVPPAGPSSIASLLPRRPSRGVRVLVTSRPHPGLPDDMEPDHPLSRCAPMTLSRSKRARQIELLANRELQEQLRGDPVQVDILGYLTASGGGLTTRELAELTKQSRWVMEERLSSGVGRSLSIRTTADTGWAATEPVYIFGHETLRELAENKLVDVLTDYRARIDRWVDSYRNRRWPADCPPYVFYPYARLLESTGQSGYLADLATDPIRHDQMLTRTFGDANALAEINASYRMLVTTPSGDGIARMVLLAIERDRLAARHRNTPLDLPALWAKLGHPDRGNAMARSIADRHDQVQAMAAVATALASSGDIINAERVASDAERLAAVIGDYDARTSALSAVAAAFAAAGNTDNAERITPSEHYGHDVAKASTSIAAALAAAGKTAEAERIVSSIVDDHERFRALIEVAASLAAAGRIPDAERLARSFENEVRVSIALTSVASKLAIVGNTDDAQRIAVDAAGIAETAGYPLLQVRALTAVVPALVGAGSIDDAERVTRQANQITQSIDDYEEQSLGLSAMVPALIAIEDMVTAKSAVRRAAHLVKNYHMNDATWTLSVMDDVAVALAMTGQITDAETFADGDPEVLSAIARSLAAAGNSVDAERIARNIAPAMSQAIALTSVAGALAAAGQTTDAHRLAVDIEQVSRTITTEPEQGAALSAIAGALAVAGRITDAEQLANTLRKANHRVQGMTSIAAALAAAGNTADAQRLARDAEKLANTMQGADHRVHALTSIAAALAAAGNTADAQRLARDAEKVANTMQGADHRVHALTSIAAALAAAGKTKDAQRLALDAERLARSIDGWANQEVKATALVGAAQGLAAAGQPKRAEAVTREAHKIAQGAAENVWDIAYAHRLPGGWLPRSKVFDAERLARGVGVTDWFKELRATSKLVQALANAGYIREAERITIKIEDVDAKIRVSNWLDKIQATSAVAQGLVKAGKAERAKRMAHAAERVAQQILEGKFGDRGNEHPALIEVAQTLAATGHTGDAERLCLLALAGPLWVPAVLVLISTGRHEDWTQSFYDLASSAPHDPLRLAEINTN